MIKEITESESLPENEYEENNDNQFVGQIMIGNKTHESY